MHCHWMPSSCHVPLKRERIVWLTEPACYSTSFKRTQVSILKAAIEGACLVAPFETSRPYISLAILSHELEGSQGKRQYYLHTWDGSWSHLILQNLPPDECSCRVVRPFFDNKAIPERQSVPFYADIDVPFHIDSGIAQEERNIIHDHWIRQLDEKVKRFVEFLQEYLEKRLGVTKCYTTFLNSHRAGGHHVKGKYSAHRIMHLNSGQCRFRTAQDIDYFLSDVFASQDPYVNTMGTYNTADYTHPRDELKSNSLPLYDKNVYRRNDEFRLPFASKRIESARYLKPCDVKGASDEVLQKLYPHTKSVAERIFLASLLIYVPKTITVTDFIIHERSAKSLERPNVISGDTYTHGDLNDTHFFELLIEEINAKIPDDGQGALSVLHVVPPGVVVFASKSTYCAIKGDFYRSNHIYWVVLLKQSLFYQRCFDENCLAEVTSDNATRTNDVLSRTAKGPTSFLHPHIYPHIDAFLERHKAQLDGLEPSIKRPRTNIDRYFHRTNMTGNGLFSFAAMSMENILAELFADIEEIT